MPALLRLTSEEHLAQLSEELVNDFTTVLSGVSCLRLGPRVMPLEAEVQRPVQPCILVTALPSAVPLATDSAGAAVVALGRCVPVDRDMTMFAKSLG